MHVIKKKLQTETELIFLALLEEALPGYRVSSQVSMNALLDPEIQYRSNEHNLKARRAFSQKVVDFVVCDKKTGDVVVLVELDDWSHDSPEARKRDQARDAMLHEAGYQTLRWDARAMPSPQTIKNRVEASQSKDEKPTAVQAVALPTPVGRRPSRPSPPPAAQTATEPKCVLQQPAPLAARAPEPLTAPLLSLTQSKSHSASEPDKVPLPFKLTSPASSLETPYCSPPRLSPRAFRTVLRLVGLLAGLAFVNWFFIQQAATLSRALTGAPSTTTSSQEGAASFAVESPPQAQAQAQAPSELDLLNEQVRALSSSDFNNRIALVRQYIVRRDDRILAQFPGPWSAAALYKLASTYSSNRGYSQIKVTPVYRPIPTGFTGNPATLLDGGIGPYGTMSFAIRKVSLYFVPGQPLPGQPFGAGFYISMTATINPATKALQWELQQDLDGDSDLSRAPAIKGRPDIIFQ